MNLRGRGNRNVILITAMPAPVNIISPQEAREKLRRDDACQIVDVRESGEYGSEHIFGSVSLPLSILDQKKSTVDRSKAIFLLCGTGRRARKAADALAESGIQDLSVIDGGIQAWIAAGYPVEHGGRSAWSLDRQVRFTAGALVLAGIILAFLLNTNWLLLSAFVAGGMIFSAVTDSCGMALLLSRMPWNTPTPPTSGPGCSTGGGKFKS